MKKGKKLGLFGASIFTVLLLVGLALFMAAIFEGESPQIKLEPLPQYISSPRTFRLEIGDKGRGLKRLVVSIEQGGRERKILEKHFPFKGLLNRHGVREQAVEFSVDPELLNLGQGTAVLKLMVRDYSRRNGGDGNLAVAEHELVVDTIPPAIRPISRLNYINVGGTRLLVYVASSDTVKSGVYVGDLFFPGFKAGPKYPEDHYVCYFTVPHNLKRRYQLFLWAEDKAGNSSKVGFYYRIRRKRFRTERINISDRFLSKVLPYFSEYLQGVEGSDIEKFLWINRQLRKKNTQTFRELGQRASAEQLWEGRWLRLRNAATMAHFGDIRHYYYKGRKVDEQVHLGVDLASLAHSKVSAANRGKVIFSGGLGIYGITVVLDHGQGLFSVYSHLSEALVQVGDMVEKGHIIGITGQTGLAGGDHLHFGVMVHGIFVNPVEWWDPHWIKDNVTRKLKLIMSR